MRHRRLVGVLAHETGCKSQNDCRLADHQGIREDPGNVARYANRENPFLLLVADKQRPPAPSLPGTGGFSSVWRPNTGNVPVSPSP